MSGPHFRDYHLLLDDHGDELLAMTDDLAERVRKVGGTYPAFNRAHRQAPAGHGQRRRLRRASRHAGGIVRGQPFVGRAYASGPWRLR